MGFQKGLSRSERINFDLEDTLMELWIALAERDDKYNPERGRYITFASSVIRHHLIAIKERAKTVHSPRNAVCRVKQYKQSINAGTISEARSKTYRDILRTNRSREALDCQQHPGGDTPDDEAAYRDITAIVTEAVSNELRHLKPTEAMAVGASIGLWGAEKQSARGVARRLGIKEERIARLRRDILIKLGEQLKALGITL